ncbi:unnamed protein product [Closterium sp. NIES-53]
MTNHLFYSVSHGVKQQERVCLVGAPTWTLSYLSYAMPQGNEEATILHGGLVALPLAAHDPPLLLARCPGSPPASSSRPSRRPCSLRAAPAALLAARAGPRAAPSGPPFAPAARGSPLQPLAPPFAALLPPLLPCAPPLAARLPTQGYTFSLASGSVSWRSTRSSSILSSSCEAEIYAVAMAAQVLRWLTYLLTDLGEQPRSPPVLYVDNKVMIALCQEHKTKHITLGYFLARELQQRGQLRLAYVATRANTADIFTKALQSDDHQRFSAVLGLAPTLPHSLTTRICLYCHLYLYLHAYSY